MLGQNITENGAYWQTQGYGTTPWPACGEVDIMEHWGSNQNYVQSAMHTPSSSGATVNHGGQYLTNTSSEFHVYEMDWNSDRIKFSVDGITHYTYNPEVQNGDTWPFYAPQYILLNFAIQESITNSFTQDAMEIDYVRVYQTNPSSVVNEVSLIEMSLYPNPTKELLTIQLQEGNHLDKAVLYNTLGQSLKTFTTTSIALTDFAAGTYFLSVMTSWGEITKQIIKE